MFKLLDSNSFFEAEDLLVHIVSPGDTTELVKAAAHEDIAAYVKDLQPQAGKFYVHINAMGAGEYYGANKNGDYFPEAQLKEYCKTFEEFGYVYRHHINKDPARSCGRVIKAIYNERMHRIELIAEVDKELGKDIEDAISAGKMPNTSMACKTPYDVCSICSNKAHTRQEYCSHLSDQMNKILPDGRKVMALNLGPLRFFDISIVIRPADITSSVLAKVASDVLEEPTVGSAEMAEIEKVTDSHLKVATVKEAAFKKLSELVKEIEDGSVTAISPDVLEILSKVSDPQESLLDTLSKFPLEEIFNAMAELRISPSVAFLAELIARDAIGEQGKGIGAKAEAAVLSVSPDKIPAIAANWLPNIEAKPANPIIKKVIATAAPTTSLMEEFVEKRADVNWYRTPMIYEAPWSTQMRASYVTKDGRAYTGFDRIETDEQRLLSLKNMVLHHIDTQGMGTLLSLGGAAVLSKFIIGELTEMKDKENSVTGKLLTSMLKSQYGGVIKTASLLVDDVKLSYQVARENKLW